MAAVDDRQTVLVLEANAKASLPVIESAHKNGRRVVAAAASRLCAGKFSRYVDERVVSPSTSDDPEGFQDWLAAYLEAHPVAMLYPVGDVGTALVAERQDEYRRHTRLVLPPYEVFQVGRDKVRTLKAARECGVPIPDTWFTDETDVEEIARQAAYPCLIKPALSAGARGIVHVADAEQLERELPEIVADYGECFVQDFIPSEGIQHKADVVIAPDGELLAGVVYDKLRYYPPGGGSSILNRTVRRPEIIEHIRKLLGHMGWSGFCDFDFITDPRDGVAKLIEINPRFPESFRATVIAGVDMVQMLWELAHDRVPEAELDYPEGQRLRFLPGDVMWFLTSPDRMKQLGDWSSFFAKDLTYQVCSLRDPGPICGYVLENLAMVFDGDRLRERLRLKSSLRG